MDSPPSSPPSPPSDTRPGSDSSSSPSGRIRPSSLLLLVLFAALPVFGLVTVLMKSTLKKGHEGSAEHKALLARLEAAKPQAPPTDAQKAAFLEFGRHLAERLSGGDGNNTRAAVDYETYADRTCAALGNLANLADIRDDFVKSIESRPGGIFGNIIGCRTACVRVTSRDGFPAVLLRAMDEKSGLRFYEVLLRSRDNGTKALDVYSYAFGSFLSDESADALKYGLSEEDVHLSAAERTKASLLKNLATALRLGNHEGVIAQYEELPAHFKNDPSFYRIYLQGLILPAEPSRQLVRLRREALKKADQILGKDNTSVLMEMDLQGEEGDLAGAEKSLEHAESVVGRDAYLTTLRGLSQLKRKNVAEAERLRDEAASMEPDLDILGDLKRLIFAAKKQYVALTNDLKSYQTKHKKRITRQQLSSQPEYADYLKSSEFAQLEAEPF